MRQRLTKRTVDALKPRHGTDGKAKRYYVWDTDLTGFGCRVTGTGHKTYLVQYRPRGKRTRKHAPKRITLGKHGQLTPEQARKLAAKLLLQVQAGQDPAAAWTDTASPTMADLTTRFLTEYLPSKKRPPRPSTVTEYERLLRVQVVPRLGTKQVRDLTTQDIEHLHTTIGATTPYQANRILSILRQAFNQAEKWGWRPQHTNPAVHIDRFPEHSRGERKEVMLSPQQLAALFAAIDQVEQDGADPYACAAIRFTVWTGWRIDSEVLRLQWQHLDIEAGRAKLVRTKTQDEEYRTLPTEAIRELQKLVPLGECPYVFPGRDSKGHLTTVRGPWRKIRTRAGLDNLDGLGSLRVHDLRHNVVSWDVSRGVPLAIAGKAVGHRSLRSTEVYAHFAPDALKQVADERARAMRDAVAESGT